MIIQGKAGQALRPYKQGFGPTSKFGFKNRLPFFNLLKPSSALPTTNLGIISVSATLPRSIRKFPYFSSSLLLGSSVSYRIAVGPQQGRKAFMIRTIRPLDRPDPGLERVAKANGFSLHAGVSCEGHQKDKRERLCRYIARPAVAIPRLSLSSTGKVVYTLKTPYRDGTTQVAFDPVDFIARLAALVPKPRVNLTRYHGVLAPNHRWRGMVTPAKRGKGVKRIANTEVRSPAERHAAMTWAQRLKRVFSIDIEVCGRCGGSVRVIACIEDQDIIDRILAHLESKEQNTPALLHLAPPTRASPKSLPLFAGKDSSSTTPHQQGRY